MGITLAQAVKYVERYKWSVIPLKPNSKIPLIDWKEYQSRLPTLAELETWFLNTQNGLGIVTGAISNIAVLDVDSAQALQQIKTTSPIVALTKKGRHFYFKYTSEKNSASKIADMVDVRGEGGFVVAPPTVVDGWKYRFVSPNVNPLLLREFPKQLLENVSSANKNSNGGHNDKSENWISQALEGLREGNRNATFASIVGRLHRDNHSSGVINTLLKPHADLHSFPLEELNNVIESVTRYENRQKEGSSIYTSGDTAENVEDFLKAEQKVEWIVPQVLARSSIGFMAGLPETFKTWILADLAIECAVGGTWLGMKVNKTKVLFIDQERFKGETQRRFKKMLKAKNLDAKTLGDNLTIQVGSTIRLNLDESFEAFRRKLQDIKPEFIVVDSFATFHTSEENNRQDIQKVLERVKQLRQEFGCTVLFIDHENKGVFHGKEDGELPSAFRMVGSVGKPAAAETVFTVRREDVNSVTLYHTKSSLASAMAPKLIQIQDTDDGGIKLVCND